MKKKQKCYIYTRVSTAVQVDGYSLDAQRDKLTKFAEYQDMEVVKEFSDAGHSGKNIMADRSFHRCLMISQMARTEWTSSSFLSYQDLEEMQLMSSIHFS